MADDDTSRNADFVARVVKDAKSPPETRMLTGWLGDAPEEGERRLYTNADLSCYIDIPTDAILHTEPIRDVQPPGGVFVWVKRDATLKPGGSAANRAARFLQGQVQQDFASGASPEEAGFRCITKVPCGEPTGFTGQCTKQPVVGGAWPCITAIPHCAEPTGFTGKCTYQPWPNPTQYIGCTIYHCPTQDLTHIPHICNLVATGMPGCPVVNPPEGGGDPEAKASAEAAGEGGGAQAVHPTPPLQLTMIPGCGYTQTWGLCPTLPQKCQVSVNIPCITQTETPRCRGGIDLAAIGGQAGGASQLCATNIGCDITIFCPTRFGLHFFPQVSPLCPVTLDCPFGQVGTPVINPGQAQGGFAAFRAVGPGPFIPVNTPLPLCNMSVAGACPSAVDACPSQKGCQTQPPTAIQPCTQIGPLCPSLGIACTLTGPECPTYCGPDCQTKLDGCTRINCTHAGPLCPTGQFECTQSGPQCPSGGPVCPTLPLGCPVTTVEHNCQVAAQPQAFRAAAPIGPTVQAGAQCPTQPSGDCTFFGCPPTPATVCTQISEQCFTQPNGDCTFFGGCQQTLATVCTQSGPQCPTHAQHCTCAGPGCPPTPATVCTQIQQQCPTQPSGDCTFFNCPTVLCQARQPQNFAAAAAARPMPTPPVTILVWQCHAPTPATRCFICPMPHHSWVPWHCPAITQTFHCGGGPSAVDACPTRLCGGPG